ncbi:DUF484 family protein [Thiomicrorhabdus sp.]|uniref:DUF484 family protein n=1 Tax=Thiomicrorhabdus sp. TaxID=2039724 RepID=UPI0035658193
MSSLLNDIHEEDVANFLNRNREFFHVFPNLLDELSIPHPETGKAVSLLERQIYQLRKQRDELQVEVDTLINIAGENGQLFNKVKEFTKALMAARSEQEAVDCIIEEMQQRFQVEEVALVSWDVPSTSLHGITQLGISQTWVETMKSTLQPEEPACGLLEDAWQKGLFHTNEPMQSVCLLPLGEKRVWGVLALGSTTDRFHPNLGTYFLRIMAEMVTARLSHLFAG